jgi:hypothetical protein
MEYFEALKIALEKNDVRFCSLGSCTTINAANMIPTILSISERFNCSIRCNKMHENELLPCHETLSNAAKISLAIADQLGDDGNFRFAIGFQCPAGIPFFPMSYHDNNVLSSRSISVGLENGDLLFLAFHGAESFQSGQENLISILEQSLMPLQALLEKVCHDNNVVYNGIDSSFNPGLTLPDSIGLGLEQLLRLPYREAFIDNKDQLEELSSFGVYGTLAAVSTATSALKCLEKKGEIKLIGYNGLMLPVMEDLILSKRASQAIPLYDIRHLLVFSSVCGVGLDTIPIPGDVSVEKITGLYVETASLAYRLNKPLSCRLLPIKSKAAGEMIAIPSCPYLCETKVFHV